MFFFRRYIIFRGFHGSQLRVHIMQLSESETLCPCYARRPSNFRLENTLSWPKSGFNMTRYGFLCRVSFIRLIN